MSNRINLNLVLVLAVALVITIPIVYGAVEPSIIINMITGQTTKPLQIKDNLGTEVFSIDVNGTIFPEQVTTNLRDFDSGMKNIFFNQISEVAFATDALGDFNTWNVFATWRVDFNSPSVDEENNPPNSRFPVVVFHRDETIMSGFIKSSNGAVNAKVAMRYSFDGTTWFNFNSITRGSLVFSGQDSAGSLGEICDRSSVGSGISDNQCLISIRLGTDTATAITATVKDLQVYMPLILPSQTTLTRII